MRELPSKTRGAHGGAIRSLRAAAGAAALACCAAGAPASEVAGDGSPKPPAHDYVGVDKCGRCHKKELIGDQVAAWREGPHAGAFETLRSEHAVAIAQERGLARPPHEAPECLLCHVTAYGVSPIHVAYELDPADGVQCESCHGPGRDFRKKKIMSDRERAIEKGLWEADRDEAICRACHNPESPTWDPGRYPLPGGGTAGFHFEQAKERIPHPIPEHVKGRYIELDEKRREAEKAAGR